MLSISTKFFSFLLIGLAFVTCSIEPENKNDTSNLPQFWLSNTDKSAMFKKQTFLQNITTDASTQTIVINENEKFQSIDGFGCALTGGSAILLNKMNASNKAALLKELFAADENNIGMSYLRISIGASDLSDRVFSYNDMPIGQTDTAMVNFSIEPEKKDLIPVLKEILAINPNIKILGSPWSAPVWMKTNNSSIGGSLKLQYYPAYAKYFVKYIQQMKAEGIRIDAITIQNEPLHGGNNPSMLMQAAEQTLFIKKHLGPAFESNKIDTKIIIYDHNADRTDYPITVLNDPEAKKYVDGSAFHLYAGSISDLSKVHLAHPDKSIYFTEQWIGAPGNFAQDLKWHIKNLFIGGTLNWCRNVIEWNLASDHNLKPHTIGGCTQCLGAITINGNTVTRNPAYYIIAHASKFVRPGSVRIESTYLNNLPNVAFKTPDGKTALIVLNDTQSVQIFKIKVGANTYSSILNAGSVGTYVL
ncbi:MAG: O-glycosyl hydrolase [Ignavibacteria bacterium]|nr:MAG: O-glycosyl hydrolase [Ignavibacteria bacterium]KAF0161715.1 MAG: O-glycosyl hydrolase [Ignavibacteria bacterium]